MTLGGLEDAIIRVFCVIQKTHVIPVAGTTIGLLVELAFPFG